MHRQVRHALPDVLDSHTKRTGWTHTHYEALAVHGRQVLSLQLVHS